ncbi:hypothetical protein [Orlajensenia leifsoniae]|uniref:Uncharacterized protein n=1 Tax=Orlajensenia leifsoniae TaxID=2561933 RepID=A0A4Y9R5I9_9MICO|nr:hypothetical protein [Leifsonia flava]TFV99901.1 hypothetical protein E4M00_01475 [Leifsonia flava]
MIILLLIPTLIVPVFLAILWSVLRVLNPRFVSRPWFYLWAAAAVVVVPPLFGWMAMTGASTSDQFHSADPFAGIHMFYGLATATLGVLTLVVLWFMRPRVKRHQLTTGPAQ